MSSNTATVHKAADPQDRFLQNIRALKSMLALKSTNTISTTAASSSLANEQEQAASPSAVGDHRRTTSDAAAAAAATEADKRVIRTLKRQIEDLSHRLEESEKVSDRERTLRESLEGAFDRLTEHRKELQRQLDQSLQQQQQSTTGSPTKKTRTSYHHPVADESGVTLETRILSVEAEKVEALGWYQQAQQKLVVKEQELSSAQRKIQQLEESLAAATTSRHSTPANPRSFSAAATTTTDQLMERAAHSETKLQDLQQAKEKLQRILDGDPAEKRAVEQLVRLVPRSIRLLPFACVCGWLILMLVCPLAHSGSIIAPKESATGRTDGRYRCE